MTTEPELERLRAELRLLRQLFESPGSAEVYPACSLENRLNVLLAEDNDLIAVLTTRLLQRDGHLVRRATTGREAVEAARKHSFDLVLMDLQMPEMDGVEAAQLIRSDERVRGLAPCTIWALTANAMVEELERCRAAGMNDAFTKPIGFAQLRERLALLSSRAASSMRSSG